MAEFWLNAKDLDAEQSQAVQAISDDSSFLLKGPAGSGKTNILLLRAKAMALRSISDVRIIVFTSSLRSFLTRGCELYGINPNSVVTQMTFFKNVLSEYSIPFELKNNFEADRNMLAGKLFSLIEERGIKDYCQAILVDESQDYTDTELLIFRRLTKRLILASDSRQSIYRATHTSLLPEKLVNENIVTLKYHYRSGLQICKVADAILSDSINFPKLQGECLYDEKSRPSSVQKSVHPTFTDQLKTVLENIRNQIDLYPNETIGILFPKRDQCEQFRDTLERSSLAALRASGGLWVDTLHGAKGWEFRAVHILGCEALPKMGPTQKRLLYTGILRAKTSAHLYFSGHVPGYLESALSVLEPPKRKPLITELFPPES